MKIVISDPRKIFAVQQDFSTFFPYLKLEFHAKPSKKGGVPSRKLLSHSSRTLGDCRLLHNKGTITITRNTTVADLLQDLRDVYGLSAVIYRRSGKAWIGTSFTAGWTLEKQNTMGGELSGSGNIEEDQAAE
jgi:hypothetical protein